MSLVAEVAKTFKQHLESITLIPSDGGRFEVELDGERVWSKLETGEFPDPGSVAEAIRERL